LLGCIKKSSFLIIIINSIEVNKNSSWSTQLLWGGVFLFFFSHFYLNALKEIYRNHSLIEINYVQLINNIDLNNNCHLWGVIVNNSMTRQARLES
jgi:hypothetical protein